eukprot:8380409-Alexandrium_andersonii.AAC.1
MFGLRCSSNSAKRLRPTRRHASSADSAYARNITQNYTLGSFWERFRDRSWAHAVQASKAWSHFTCSEVA